jgi:two-component system sensor histidine kinase KdpD
MVALATVACFLIYPHFELANLIMLYLLATLLVGSRGRKGPAAFTAVLGVLCFDFFFVPPRFSFSVSDAQYLLTFVVMFMTAMVISRLTIRLRLEAETARQGEMRTAAMHAFTQRLAAARGADEILKMAIAHLSDTFQSGIIIFTPNEKKILETHAASSEKERAVAQWAFEKEQHAGLGTASLPSEDSLYIPLMGTAGGLGVIKIKPHAESRPLTREQNLLLESFSHQIALALEVEQLQDSARKAEVEAESERLRSALLSSVSHDFRTPLTAIVGSASALIDKKEIRNSAKGLELLETIQSEGERLSRLVQNLLETTRLESGAVRLRTELYPLEEIIGSSLERLKKILEGRAVTVKIPEDMPAIPMDGMLIEQVMMNLLENANRHTPPQSAIEISAETNDQEALISVVDEGPGVRAGDNERVFEKFFHDPASKGAGLGLAICRAVVNAHGGRIWVENKSGGGAMFRFTLPRS